MKKFKALMLGSVMVMSFSMLTACGKVPEPTVDEVIEALVDEDVISKEQKKEGKFEVKINEVEINEDQDKATVECDLTIQDGPVSKTTEYEIKFKIRDDKESWRVRKGKVEAGETKSELTEKISDDKVKELIEYDSFTAEDQYINLNDDTTTYEIKEHKLDKKAMTDTVTIEGTSKEGYLDVTFTIKYTFSYSGNWYWTTDEVTESSSEYVDGYEIKELKSDIFAKMLSDDSESFWIMGYYYNADSEDVSISNVVLGEIKYEGKYAYADVTFDVKEADVEFTLDSDVVLYFDTDSSQWSFNYFNDYTLTAFKCGAIGTWKGTNDDDTVVITINDTLVEDDDNLSASITITTPEGVTGTYDAYINEYEPGNLYMSIEDLDWTTKPEDSSLYKETFYGYYDETITTFKGAYTWDKWSFTKEQ